MRVRDGMSEVVLTVGPEHSLRQAADAMCSRKVGAAVVLDPEAHGPGVITERDILRAVAAGRDVNSERVADWLTTEVKFATPDWSLEQAAASMVRGGFRHLLIVEGGELTGVLSMRDIVRVWTQDGASCEIPPWPEAPSTRAPVGA